MWKQLTIQSKELPRMVEVMKGMNSWYQEKMSLERLIDDVKGFFRQEGATLHYYKDDDHEIFMALIPKKEFGKVKIQNAGYRGTDPVQGMVILSAKVKELIQEMGMPFYANIPQNNFPLGNQFYGAIPDATQEVGLKAVPRKETSTREGTVFGIWNFG